MSSLAVRVMIALGAVVVLLGAPTPTAAGVALLGSGTALAVGSPARIGAAPALLASVYVTLRNAPADVGIWSLMLSALGLYLIHTATALAATCPLDTRLSLAVVRHWGRACAPSIGVGAGALALAAGLGAGAVQPARWLVVGALALVLAAVVGLGRQLRRN